MANDKKEYKGKYKNFNFYTFNNTKLGSDVIPAKNRKDAIKKAKARGYTEDDLRSVKEG